MRDFRYLIVTPVVGALAGAVFGLTSLGVLDLLVDGLGGFPHVWDAYTFVAVVGAAVGAISLPLVSWWIVRHVSLARVVAETGLTTVIGSIAGSLLSDLNPLVGLASAFLGFCLGAMQLRLRSPPSEAISRSPRASLSYMTEPTGSRSTPDDGDPRFLFGAITVVLLLVIASLAWRDVWPLVTYRPTRAAIDSTTIEVREGRRGSRYVPRVYFTYSVDGDAYRGTRVTPADLKGKKGWAEHLVAQHPPGASVTAYYDPQQPDRAFLRHSAGSFWGMLAMFLVWIGLAHWSVLTAARARLRSWRRAQIEE